MSYEKNLTSSLTLSQHTLLPSTDDNGVDPAKQVISQASVMLTPLEEESLRRAARESKDYFQKAFAHLRPQPDQLMSGM